MNKSQILILLLIIALVFYYLNEEKQPKSSNSHSPDEPWLIVKKSTKPQAPKPSSAINLPPQQIEKLLPQGWPAHFPTNEPKSFHATEPQPSNFGLNPPHSQLNESKNTEPPEINCPDFITAPKPTIKFPSPEVETEPPEPTKLPVLNCPEAEEILQFFTNNEADQATLNETYRQKFLVLLNDFTATSLTLQALDVLQVKDKPLSEYFSAIWKLKGLSNYQEQMAQPLKEWINLTTEIKPSNASTDYGWLTDDNLEFILNNYQPIQSALHKTKNFHLRTDIANIYNSFQKAKTNQDWDFPEFLQELELTKCQYTLFPLRVNGNHWGLFILHNLTWQDLTATYQVYYTSSGGVSLAEEKQQLQPFINQICGENTPIQIIPPTDRQSKGYECGVYLVFYLQEILETKQLKLQRTHSTETCQQFRWEWKARIGEPRWCQLT